MCSQPKGVKTKMIGHQLGRGGYWQGPLKQKGLKQGLSVIRLF
jgi:hypothetical protein